MNQNPPSSDSSLLVQADPAAPLSLTTFLNNLPGMAYRCLNDAHWTMEFVSRGAELLTGYTASDLVGNRVIAFADLIHPSDRPAVVREVEDALLEHRPFHMSYRIRHADGSERQLWEQGQGIFRDGRLEALEGFITDVTPLRQSQSALHAAESRFRTLLESSKDGVILGDQGGNIIGWNDGAREIFGYTEAEIIGKPIETLMPERYQNSHRRGITHLNETGEGRLLGSTVEMHGRRQDGSEFPLEISLNSWVAPDGSRFFNGIIRDISERKAVESGLVAYTRQMQTAADLAQQINNILDPELLLDEIVHQLQTRFDLYHVHVYLMDDKGANLVVRAGSGVVGQSLLDSEHTISLQQSQSLVAQAARSREIVNIGDVRNNPAYLPNPLLPDTRSEVAVPLVVSSQLVGVLDIQDNVLNRFTTSELDVFRALSGQIATTLENSKLFRQVENNLAEAQARLLVSEILTHAETEDEILEALVTQGAVYRDTSFALAFWIPDAEAPTLEIRRATSYESGVVAFQEGMRFPASQFTVLNSLTATESFVSNDIDSDPRYDDNARAILDTMNAKSATAIPLTVRNEWLGALVLISPQINYFDEHKLYLYHAIAEQGAESIVRARLSIATEQARAQAEQERSLLNQIMTNLPVGLLVTDAQGKPLLTNEAAMNLFGGQNWGEPDDAAGYTSTYSITQLDGTPYPNEQLPVVRTLTDHGHYHSDNIFVRHANGRRLNLSTSSAPLYTTDNTFMGSVTSYTDISAQHAAADERLRYTRQLQTAAELAGRITSILDLEQLLEEIVTELQARFDLYHVHVYLLDEHSQQLVMTKGSGTVGAELRARRHAIAMNRERSLVAEAARTQSVVMVDDVLDTGTFLANPLLPDTRSEVAVPLVAAGRIVGVLDVQDDAAHRFVQGDLDVFRTLAGLIATALQNVSLFEQVQTNLSETENRLRVSEALANAETEADIFNAVINVGGFYPDTLLAVALWDKEAATPTVRVVRSDSYDSGMPRFPDNVRFTPAEFPLISLLNSTEPFVSANIQTDDRVGNSSRVAAQMMGQQGAVILPMNVGGEWIGGIVVASLQANYFDEHKLSLYRALAEQGGEALTRARLRAANADLLRQVTASLAETESRLRVSQALADTQSEDDVLDALMETGGFYQDTMLALALWDTNADDPTVEIVRSNAFESEMPSFPIGARFTAAEFFIISLLTDTDPFVSEDMQADERVNDSSRAAAQMMGQRGAAIIPMNVGGDWIGGIVVASRHTNYFDEQKMSLYRALADQGSEALTRARLRAATESATEALSASEARYRTLADNSVDMISRHNAAGAYTYVSPSVRTLLGYEPHMLMGHSAYDFIIGTDQEVVRETHDWQMENDDTRTSRFRMRRADGSATWVESTSQAVFDEEGVVQEIVVVTRNVDDRVSAEQERRHYTRQLQTAATLAERINTILDLDDLLTETVAQLQSQFDLYHVHIYLLDPADEHLVMLQGSGDVGETLRERNHRIPLLSERSLVARAARLKDIVVVNEVQHEEDFLPNELLPDTESEVAVPLIAAGRVLGVLDVQDNAPHRFSTADLDVLRTLAGLIATSLQNAELYQQVERSLQETRLRLQAAQAFATTFSEGEVQETLMALAAEVNPVNLHLFTMIERDEERYAVLHSRYTADTQTRAIPIGMRFRWDDFMASRYVEAEDGLFISGNVFTDERVDDALRALFRQVGTLSTVVIPIRLDRTLYGFILASSPHENAFNREEGLQLYNIIAERGALAWREAQLYDQVQLSLKRTNIRFAVSQALAQAQSEEDVLDALIQQAGFTSGANVTIATYDTLADVPTLVIRRSDAFDSNVYTFPLGARFTLAESPLMNLVSPDAPFIAADLTQDARVDDGARAVAAGVGAMSGGLFPITSGGRMIGTVTVLSETPNFFDDPATVYLYESLAEQGAVALRAARLFDETQETAERLKELDRLKSEFLANMSHELRTPLNSIIGYAEIMLMGINGPLNDETTEDVNAIRSSGQHLLRLINDILDLAKIEAGRMALDTEEVGIAGLMEEIRVAHLGIIHKKDIALHVTVEPMRLKIQADRLRLSQILTNLVSNAVKFTERGQVTVRASQDNDEWMRIEVADTGIGIEPESLEAIFEEFRQADGSSTRRAEGTGLGLSITRRLVQMHGGIITVDSVVNKGSLFTVRLPIRTLTSFLN